MTAFYPEGRQVESPENRGYLKSMATLQEAFEQRKILEARAILCDSQHNLIVDLGCARGIIPHDEGALGIAEGTTRDIAVISRVNKPVCFVITGFQTQPDGSLLPILSRRAVQKRCMEEKILQLHPGDIIDARVTHLEPFGCFVDIGCGISSLIPIDAISVSRIAHPRDRFRPGFDIKAVVRQVDPDGRVNLTHKELLGSWEENAALFSPGQTVAGIIRSVESYGVFVELTPNLAGLAEPKEGAFPGQHASVYIKSLLPDKMKVKLILVDSFEAQYPPQEPRYFVESDHMDRWQYSPDCASRIIETRFDQPDTL